LEAGSQVDRKPNNFACGRQARYRRAAYDNCSSRDPNSDADWCRAASHNRFFLAASKYFKGGINCTLSRILDSDRIAKERTTSVPGNLIQMSTATLDRGNGDYVNVSLRVSEILRIEDIQQRGGVHDIIK
jgi:hypothetical protein